MPDATTAADETSPTSDPAAPVDRQCGRCRAWFPGVAGRSPTAMAPWWLCPDCRPALLGPHASADPPVG